MYSGSEDDMQEDEEFLQLAIMVTFPISRKIIRERLDHFSIWTEDEFFNRFRISKNVAQFVLGYISDAISSSTNRNSAVSPALKLLVTLRYYATDSFLSVCGDFSGIHKSTASRIVRKVSHELALLRPLFINFPETPEEITEVRQQFYNIAKFPRCIGAIDCTHIRIKSPGGRDAEIYRNRKGYFSFNVQTICDAHLRIQNIVCRWPGSAHDSTIFNHSAIRNKFERGEMGNCVLVGDSGYALKTYLMTPFLNPATEGENLYNEAQIRTRNPVERSYGVWKRRFPVLATGINLHINSVERIVVATAVLHNIANHFGDAIPRVTRNIEHLIRLGQLPIPHVVNQQRMAPTSKRNSFVRYFEGL